MLTLLLTASDNAAIEEKIFEFSDKLDKEFLTKNYTNNLKLARSIFEYFIENIQKEMTSLEKSVQELDFESIRAIAHKNKNNFIYVGAQNLSTIMKQLEDEGKQENPSASETFNKFKENSSKTLDAVTEQLSSIKSFLDA